MTTTLAPITSLTYSTFVPSYFQPFIYMCLAPCRCRETPHILVLSEHIIRFWERLPTGRANVIRVLRFGRAFRPRTSALQRVDPGEVAMSQGTAAGGFMEGDIPRVHAHLWFIKHAPRWAMIIPWALATSFNGIYFQEPSSDENPFQIRGRHSCS